MIKYYQHTLKKSVTLSGVGVHSGALVTVRLEPAPINYGIEFVRSDLKNAQPIPARYDVVSNTHMSTTLQNQDGVQVSTVEHLMAAISGAGITNCIIHVSGPEIPIMDGSSIEFSKAIHAGGVITQNHEALSLMIKRDIVVNSGHSWVKIEPALRRSFTVNFDFNQKLPPLLKQSDNLCFDMDKTPFTDSFAHARTFGLFEDAQKIQSLGLAKGASLENTVIIKDDYVMNTGGLRHPDEFAQHKILDAVGDLALSPVIIVGAYSAYNGSHDLNNKLMRQIFQTHSL